jgi:hypothetical protein
VLEACVKDDDEADEKNGRMEKGRAAGRNDSKEHERSLPTSMPAQPTTPTSASFAHQQNAGQASAQYSQQADQQSSNPASSGRPVATTPAAPEASLADVGPHFARYLVSPRGIYLTPFFWLLLQPSFLTNGGDIGTDLNTGMLDETFDLSFYFDINGAAGASAAGGDGGGSGGGSGAAGTDVRIFTPGAQ